MAAIIELPSAIPGMTSYVAIHNASGQYWNGTTFETFNGANWSNYATGLIEDRFNSLGSGYYKAPFPSSAPVGKYSYSFYQQGGGSPSFGDAPIGSGEIFWNGSTEEQGVGVAVAATQVTLASSQPSITIGAVTTVNGLGSTALASIAAAVQTLLNATNMPELTSVPSPTPTVIQALMFSFMAMRNQHTATGAQERVFNNGGTAIATAQLTDDGTTFTKGQFQ